METAEAVDRLVIELEKDPQYYYSWQSNIAMAFYGEMQMRGYEIPDMHEAANAAAKNFLDMLIRRKQ